uniref:AAA-ATPase-like domain-containing protein n=1 Tax=Clastoptera arizonana TaxID=38151 RepID=A0A1B6EEM5_9HEMI
MVNKIVSACLLLLIHKQLLSYASIQVPKTFEQNDFEGAVKSEAFVDKTEFIKEFFKHKFILFTAPKRFGKTINLDMLYRFSALNVSSSGSVVPRENTDNFKLFTENNVEIYKDKTFFNLHFGRYPSIYFHFGNLWGRSFRDFIFDFKTLIGDLYSTYPFFATSLSGTKLDRYLLHFDAAKMVKSSLSELVRSGRFLTRLLSRFFNKKVFVFIDELDGVVQDIILKAGKEEHRIILFLRKFLFNLLDPNLVEKAVLSGCTSYCTMLLTNTTNMTIKHYQFYEEHVFNKLHGFTDREVKKALKQHGMKLRMTTILDWYDSYRIPGRFLTLLNPRSIYIFIVTRVLEDYWSYSLHFFKSRRLMRKRPIWKKIDDLTRGEDLYFNVINKFTVEDVTNLKEIYADMNETAVLDEHQVDLCLYFLLDYGFFTVKYVRDSQVKILVPNKEVEYDIVRVLDPEFH